MAFGLPSSQSDYVLCSEFDPALDLLELPTLGEDPSEDDKAAYRAVVEERNRLVKLAHATGNWRELSKPGEQPTYFKFRQIHGTLLTWLQGEVSRQRLNADEAFELAFRLALKSIDNFGGLKLEFDQVPGMNRKIVSRKSIEPIYNIGRSTNRPLLGRSIVLELGGAVWSRALEGVPPLS